MSSRVSEGLANQPTAPPPRARSSRRRARRKVYGHVFVCPEEVDDRLQLFVILIGKRHRRVGSRETMGMHLAVDVAEVLRVDERHMAVDAFL